MIAQQSEEWLAERVGALTSTRAHSVFGTPNMRLTLIRQIVVEVARAERKSIPRTKAMEKGNLDEPAAIAAYVLKSGEPVDRIVKSAYIESDFSPFIATSPDALINHNGILEVKNLDPDNHYKIFDTELVPTEYIDQCLWHLMVTGREWCDFFSYCKELPVHLSSYRCRILPLDIDMYREKALSFVELLMDHLRMRGLTL